MRELDVNHFGAGLAEGVDGFLSGFLDGIRHALEFVILLRKTDFESLEGGVLQTFRKAAAGGFEAGGVLRVVTADRIKHDGGIFHCLGDGADLIEGRSKCDETEAGDASIGRLESDDSAEGGGLADGTAGVGCKRGGDFVGSDRRGGTAA